jgi:hypothetical protein
MSHLISANGLPIEVDSVVIISAGNTSLKLGLVTKLLPKSYRAHTIYISTEGRDAKYLASKNNLCYAGSTYVLDKTNLDVVTEDLISQLKLYLV